MFSEVQYWLAVGLVAIASLAFFKLLAAKVGGRLPALADLAAFV